MSETLLQNPVNMLKVSAFHKTFLNFGKICKFNFVGNKIRPITFSFFGLSVPTYRRFYCAKKDFIFMVFFKISFFTPQCDTSFFTVIKEDFYRSSLLNHN